MLRKRYPGRLGLIALLATLALGIQGCTVGVSTNSVATAPPETTPAGPAGVATATPGPLPNIQQKQPPVETTFNGCPPEGDGGDPVLNRLKNRVDQATYIPVQFDAAEQLPWPPGIERKDHDRWSRADAATVSQYEGIPIAVEGYLFEAREQGPESTNCHGADSSMRDFHVWLVKSRGDDRSGSIVTEMTPRLRAQHPKWTVSLLNQIAKAGDRVRVSGWFMLDPEHPDQVGKTRGTIWEIHPIMLLEVQRQGQWISIDDL